MNATAPPVLRLRVLGTPRTKGSLRPWHKWSSDGKCRHGLSEQGGFDLAHWRTLVCNEATKTMRNAPPLDGPLYVQLAFWLPRPAHQSPLERAIAWVFARNRNDLDKHVRCILDCLTDAAVYWDDGQVSKLCAEKRYADGEPLGVQVMVERLR